MDTSRLHSRTDACLSVERQGRERLHANSGGGLCLWGAYEFAPRPTWQSYAGEDYVGGVSTPHDMPHERYPEPWPNLGPWLIPAFWIVVLLGATIHWAL